MDRDKLSKVPANSMEWRPIKEKCGLAAYFSNLCTYPISYSTLHYWKDSVKCNANWELEEYEDRRIFEDSIGHLQKAAYATSKKNFWKVYELVKPLIDTGEPVKIRGAFDVMAAFALGGTGIPLKEIERPELNQLGETDDRKF